MNTRVLKYIRQKCYTADTATLVHLTQIYQRGTTLTYFAQYFESKYMYLLRQNLSIWIRWKPYHAKTSSSRYIRRLGGQPFIILVINQM